MDEKGSPREKLANYYGLLGVKFDASVEEIKAVYRQRAAQLRPDRPNSSEERLQELRKARDTLTNPETRRVYDAMLAEKRARMHGFIRPPPFDKVTKPVGVVLADDNEYTFETAPSKLLRIGVNHGDQIEFKGKGGVFIGVSNDGWFFWKPDGLSYAIRLCQCDNDSERACVHVKARATVPAPKVYANAVAKAGAVPEGTPRRSGTLSRGISATELKAGLQQKERAKLLTKRLDEFPKEERESRERMEAHLLSRMDNLHSYFTIITSCTEEGTPIPPVVLEWLNTLGVGSLNLSMAASNDFSGVGHADNDADNDSMMLGSGESVRGASPRGPAAYSDEELENSPPAGVSPCAPALSPRPAQPVNATPKVTAPSPSPFGATPRVEASPAGALATVSTTPRKEVPSATTAAPAKPPTPPVEPGAKEPRGGSPQPISSVSPPTRATSQKDHTSLPVTPRKVVSTSSPSPTPPPSGAVKAVAADSASLPTPLPLPSASPPALSSLVATTNTPTAPTSRAGPHGLLNHSINSPPSASVACATAATSTTASTYAMSGAPTATQTMSASASSLLVTGATSVTNTSLAAGPKEKAAQASTPVLGGTAGHKDPNAALLSSSFSSVLSTTSGTSKTAPVPTDAVRELETEEVVREKMKERVKAKKEEKEKEEKEKKSELVEAEPLKPKHEASKGRVPDSVKQSPVKEVRQTEIISTVPAKDKSVPRASSAEDSPSQPPGKRAVTTVIHTRPSLTTTPTTATLNATAAAATTETTADNQKKQTATTTTQSANAPSSLKGSSAFASPTRPPKVAANKSGTLYDDTTLSDSDSVSESAPGAEDTAPVEEKVEEATARVDRSVPRPTLTFAATGSPGRADLGPTHRLPTSPSPHLSGSQPGSGTYSFPQNSTRDSFGHPPTSDSQYRPPPPLGLSTTPRLRMVASSTEDFNANSLPRGTGQTPRGTSPAVLAATGRSSFDAVLYTARSEVAEVAFLSQAGYGSQSPSPQRTRDEAGEVMGGDSRQCSAKDSAPLSHTASPTTLQAARPPLHSARAAPVIVTTAVAPTPTTVSDTSFTDGVFFSAASHSLHAEQMIVTSKAAAPPSSAPTPPALPPLSGVRPSVPVQSNTNGTATPTGAGAAHSGSNSYPPPFPTAISESVECSYNLRSSGTDFSAGTALTPNHTTLSQAHLYVVPNGNNTSDGSLVTSTNVGERESALLSAPCDALLSSTTDQVENHSGVYPASADASRGSPRTGGEGGRDEEDGGASPSMPSVSMTRLQLDGLRKSDPSNPQLAAHVNSNPHFGDAAGRTSSNPQGSSFAETSLPTSASREPAFVTPTNGTPGSGTVTPETRRRREPKGKPRYMVNTSASSQRQQQPRVGGTLGGIAGVLREDGSPSLQQQQSQSPFTVSPTSFSIALEYRAASMDGVPNGSISTISSRASPREGTARKNLRQYSSKSAEEMWAEEVGFMNDYLGSGTLPSSRTSGGRITGRKP